VSRRPTKGPPLRRAFTWTGVLFVVLIIFASFAVQRSLLLREEELRATDDRIAAELVAVASLWESLISDRLESWLDSLEQHPSPDAWERSVRERIPWFDAAYSWKTHQGIVRFHHPVTLAPPPEELSACLAGGLAARLGAEGAIASCEGDPRASRLLVDVLIARRLRGEGRDDAALRWLMESTLPLSTPLTKAPRLPLKPLLARREVALLLLKSSRPKDAEALRAQTVAELLTLNGAALVAALPAAERLGTPSELGEPLSRARRRLAAWRAISGQLGTTTAEPSDALRIIHDTYSTPGFLLAWRPLPGDRGVAVQIDVRSLLRTLIEIDPRMVVLDTEGRTISGTVEDPTDDQQRTTVPLTALFPQLRLGRTASAAERTRLGAAETAMHFAPIVLAAILGLIALWEWMSALRRQRELLERQRAFIARVTHELKTPLAGIRVMAENLEMGAADPLRRGMFLRRIIEEAEKLGRRIDEVLAVARRPSIGTRTSVELHVLAEDMLKRWRPRFEQAGARLEADLRPCRPVPVDRDMLWDALNNLLDNALKYRREDVPLLCRVRTGPMGRWLVIEVSDNGIGVPTRMRRRIFERFTRVEGQGRGKAGGHGLGLSFVAEAVAAHGGLVECREGIDGGSCFRVKLNRSG